MVRVHAHQLLLACLVVAVLASLVSEAAGGDSSDSTKKLVKRGGGACKHGKSNKGHKKCHAKKKPKASQNHLHSDAASAHGGGGGGDNHNNGTKWDGTMPCTTLDGKKYCATPPNGKAGVSGGQSLRFLKGLLGWYNDWTPDVTISVQGAVGVPMLWGLGRVGTDDDRERFDKFMKLEVGKYPYVIGFNEADWHGKGSSGVIPPEEAAAAWDKYIAPHGDKGALLVSPSCAKQLDEDWLSPFLKAVKRKPDMINVHIFQHSADGIEPVLDHYAKFGKPMWVTEVACISYQSKSPSYCSQEETDDFIRKAIDIFERRKDVAAYAIADAYNGPNSYLTPDHSGKALTHTGQTFKQVLREKKMLRKRSLAQAA